jgi:hypothetical protein
LTFGSKKESEANMKSKCIKLLLASVILLVLSGQVLAKRVNHDVTPANIDKLPFSATVKVKGLGKVYEFEITIKSVKGNPFRPSAPGGWLEIPNDGKPAATPAVTKVEKDGIVTFTFQLIAEQAERARFAFVEDAEDWKKPFPAKGDYYQFILKEFTGGTKK